MQTLFSFSPLQTERLAGSFAPSVPSGSVVALTGDLGMGKTTFVRGFVRGLGNAAPVSSPTFAIVNDYGGKPHLYHFDMYRVKTIEDLQSTGFFDYMNDDSILLIEWSENIRDALPENTIYVDISRGASDNARVIQIHKAEEKPQ